MIKLILIRIFFKRLIKNKTIHEIIIINIKNKI